MQAYLASAPAVLLAQNAPPGGAFGGYSTLLFFGAIIAVFYFFIIRPQKKREKERTSMIDSLKKGNRVVTIGGVYGTVVSIKEDSVVLRVDEERDIHMRYIKSAISRIIEDPAEEEKK
jgi:preprotein translocase subunit YajC